MFDKIFIANRGEIAVRIIKTARRLGIATVVGHSDADEGAPATEMADEAIRIGAAPAAESYLLADTIVAAAKVSGAQAVHPGYGFLAENAAFAKSVTDTGLVFVGPNAEAIALMGDKIAAKRAARDAGVNVIPGPVDEIADDAAAATVAEEIGYPVLVKATAGGGGKGMRAVRGPETLADDLAAARREAESAFGDARVFLEKLIERPRHIEIQLLGDAHGDIVHLNERECSIQRRNQKVIEEAPSPFVDAKLRRAMGEQAIALAKAVGYDSAGTVEFVVDPDGRFYFLEMNTRLQVEHPVTELVTGLDLVELMLRVAAGEPLPFKQKDVALDGWALEARLYAEDPRRGFLPSIGRLARFHPPTERSGREGRGRTVRVDSGVAEGGEITMFYDPMIAKVATHAPDRAGAIDAMADALDELEVEGVETNAEFLAAVLRDARFRSGDISTGFIAETFPDGFRGVAPDDADRALFLAVASYIAAFDAQRADRRAADGTVTPPAQRRRRAWTVVLDGAPTPVEVDLEPEGASVRVADAPRPSALKTDWRPGQRTFRGRLDDTPFTVKLAPTLEGWTLARRGARARIVVAAPRAAELRAALPEKPPAAHKEVLLSPMPGLVAAVSVAEGQPVKAGEPLMIVEAMKMENVLRAARDGVVKAIHAAPGESVAADSLLIEFE